MDIVHVLRGIQYQWPSVSIAELCFSSETKIILIIKRL